MKALFRSIRQNIFQQGKTGNYLKYAFSETLLVVLGILIALQVNNWNESKKEDKLKQSYYEQLLADLAIDINYAEERIATFESEIKNIDSYNQIYEEADLSIAFILEAMLANISSPTGLAFETSTIESLINTGDIGLFDLALREYLIQYNRSKEENMKTYAANMDDVIDLLKEANLKGAAVLLEKNHLNQTQLKEMLSIEKRYSEIYLSLTSYYYWKIRVYAAYVNNLNQCIGDANEIKKLISAKLDK